MTPELIDTANRWLRISTDALDDEIDQTMEAAMQDLKNAGVNEPWWEDRLVQQAVKLYCKAQFGYGDENDKFSRAYEYLKNALALSGDYNHNPEG